MEPVNESSDDETSSTSHSVWWKRKIYDHAMYRLDSDRMIQKIYHDPDSEELNAKTRGRTKTPPPRGGLKKSENSTFVRDGDRGSTPISFKPLARPAKYFVQGACTSNITNEPFGPTKLEMSPFKSSDSEGHNAWHSSQSPHDLDAPLPETPTPRMVGTTVSQTLIRDSEGWFVLMDVEESPAAVWHHQELMGWRDSKKLIESEDETADHGSRSDSDTESHISMVQNPSTHSHILDPAKRTEPERVTKDMAVTHDRTPIIGNGTIQLPEQKLDESTIKNGIQEPSPSNPSSDCSSEKGTYMGDNLNTFNAFTGVTVMTNNGSGAEAVQSPKAPIGHRLLKATDSSSFPPNTTDSSHDQEPQSMRSFTLEEFLNRFGDFIMVESPIPQVLFKVGSLMYLLFLIRVLWKIWAMFRSQPLAVGFGNLGISVALLFLLRLWVPEHIKVQVDQSHRVPEIVVDSCVFVGAYTCVSIIAQTASIIGDFVVWWCSHLSMVYGAIRAGRMNVVDAGGCRSTDQVPSGSDTHVTRFDDIEVTRFHVIDVTHSDIPTFLTRHSDIRDGATFCYPEVGDILTS
ncbi:hypothetical protein C8R42DRAFT_722901 [Lentinula raphanica]|nr:hypothetical protein C8R42DRAFT_722901 [Lentinula raphanica]